MQSMLRSKRHALRLLIGMLALSTDVGTLLAQELTAPSVVRAKANATLSSTISGKVNRLHVDEGEGFSRNDVLAEIDCSIYRSEAAASRSEAVGALAIASSRETLFSRGGSGQLEVDVAKAEAAAAMARADSAELRVQKCMVRAPYDGLVVEHAVNEHEYVEPGQPILSIVSSGTPELEIIAPAEWLSWLETGAKGKLTSEATSAVYEVIVNAIAPVVDPVSRTVKLMGTIQGETDGLLPGMSGLVTLRPGN